MSAGAGGAAGAPAGGLRVAVVGATGAVGTVMLRLLRSRAWAGGGGLEIVPFASSRSVGRELEGGLVVQPLDDETIQGFDVALFSAGATRSREWAQRFVDAGAVVVTTPARFAASTRCRWWSPR